MQQTFTGALGTATPYTVDTVKEAIKAVNDTRWQRLLLLLEYIEDQGEFLLHNSLCTGLVYNPYWKILSAILR